MTDITTLAENCNCDRAEAERFLKLLDPKAKAFTFQCLPDSGGATKPLILHGTLSQHWDKLCDQNARGAGIFVCINETDLKGRTADNIVRVRALFLDLDGAALEPVMQGKHKPHFVVESSPGHWHTYWRVSDVKREQFAELQKALAARFDGDTNVHDLPRIMRLPGFFHRKREPFLTRIISTHSAPAYAASDFATLGMTGKQAPAPAGELDPFEEFARSRYPDRPPPLAKVAAALKVIPDDDRSKWITIGHALKSSYPGDEGLELFKEWSKTFTDGEYDEKYVVQTWKSFKPTNITIGTVFFYADEISPGWWERAQAVATKDLEVFDAGDDVTLPPPRAWLLGTSFARKFLSSILADGGTGKTALRYAQLVALATEHPITGEHVFQRCRVLIVSLEDDRDELQRRILAVLKHYGIDRSELKGWLFYATPGADSGKLMTTDKHGGVIRGKLADTIEAIVSTRGIDIVALDPFVKSHSVEENSNSAVDDVVQVLTDLAAKYDIAVDSPHHVSKGPADPGNANRGRGASAMKDAARLVYTLTRMDKAEAATFAIDEEERVLLIRLDSGKVNITRPTAASKWFRLVGIALDNGNTLYPNGDEVQTVEPWTPPSAWENLDKDLLDRILTAIDAGLPDGNRYTDGRNAGGRAAWHVVCEYAPTKSEAQGKQIVKAWVEGGILVSRGYTNPTNRHVAKGLFLDPQKRPK